MSSLSNKFRGAIAGAMLGYFIGLHYESTDQTTDKLSLGGALDWSWLTSLDQRTASAKKIQAVLTLFFRIELEDFEAVPSSPQAKNGPQDVNAPIYHDHPVKQDSDSFEPIFDMLRVLNHLLDEHPSSVQYGHTSTIFATPIANQNLLHAILTLLPLLLLYHDNITKQHNWIQSWLQHWQYPNEWFAEVKAVGVTLTQAMRFDTIGPLVHPTLLCIDQSNTHASHYEMGILALLHQLNRSERGWAIVPLMAGLNGGILGCIVGFSGLPLIWRYSIARYAQSLSSNPYVSQRSDAGARLAALWSGQNKPLGKQSLEKKYPTTRMPRSIP